MKEKKDKEMSIILYLLLSILGMALLLFFVAGKDEPRFTEKSVETIRE